MLRRKRIAVFLFQYSYDVAAILGPRYAGGAAAHPNANAILLAYEGHLAETIGHELTHLFSARWNAKAPSILNEGLAIWMQETLGGVPIDQAARPLLYQQYPKLAEFTSERLFFDRSHSRRCYTLAGSFTGFLLRRFGWAKYRDFFRTCNRYRFKAKFAACFGISLEKAESQWRDEVIVMEILGRRLKGDICP
jgi:hypothetical protein